MADRFVSPFLMWTIAALGGLLARRLFPHAPLLFDARPYSLILLIAAFIVWLSLFGAALTRNREVARSAANVRHLRTSGIYGVVRHPIYAADMLLTIAILAYIPTAWTLAAGSWLVVVLTFWTYLEEGVLIRRFGETYTAYKEAVPRLVPRFREKSGRFPPKSGNGK